MRIELSYSRKLGEFIHCLRFLDDLGFHMRLSEARRYGVLRVWYGSRGTVCHTTIPAICLPYLPKPLKPSCVTTIRRGSQLQARDLTSSRKIGRIRAWRRIAVNSATSQSMTPLVLACPICHDSNLNGRQMTGERRDLGSCYDFGLVLEGLSRNFDVM